MFIESWLQNFYLATAAAANLKKLKIKTKYNRKIITVGTTNGMFFGKQKSKKQITKRINADLLITGFY